MNDLNEIRNILAANFTAARLRHKLLTLAEVAAKVRTRHF